MQDRKMIVLQNDTIKLTNLPISNYLCSFIWPIIESYWVCLTYLFTIQEE